MDLSKRRTPRKPAQTTLLRRLPSGRPTVLHWTPFYCPVCGRANMWQAREAVPETGGRVATECHSCGVITRGLDDARPRLFAHDLPPRPPRFRMRLWSQSNPERARRRKKP